MSKKIDNQGDSKPQDAMTIDASKPMRETVKPIDFKSEFRGTRETPARTDNIIDAPLK
jgi:hypothetical protein